MGLEEQPVGADGHRRAGQRLDHRAVAAGRCAETARFLYAMRGVKDHGDAQGLHLWDRSHVVDQPSIAEKRASLAQQDVLAAAGLELADDVLHVPGGEKLALFDVHRPARLGRRHQQIGLPGQKGGNLQQIADLAAGAACSGRWMSVVTGRPVACLTWARSPVPAESGAPIGVDARAVGLVE